MYLYDTKIMGIMIGKLIKWGLIIIIAVLAYNYFFGTEEERERSQSIFQQTKEVGVAVVDFVKDETEKVKDGKYNDVIDNISGYLRELKTDSNAVEVENIRTDLERAQEDYESDGNNADSIKQRLNHILDRVEDLKKN